MPTYIDADDVRRACGAPTSLISDADINSAIDIVEPLVERMMNTKFTPTTAIETQDGTNKGSTFTAKNPLLGVRYLEINDTSIDLDDLNIYQPSGMISLKNTAGTSIFLVKEKNVIIKYLYGMLNETSTSTTTSAAASAGSSVSVAVTSSASFTAEDWIVIYGTDGNREHAQISAIADSTHVTLDQIGQDHASGSLVVEVLIPYYIKRMMEIEAGIYVAINAIGSTYTFNTSYTLGELTVNKGEPYPQWNSVFQRMQSERKYLNSLIKIRPSIVVN